MANISNPGLYRFSGQWAEAQDATGTTLSEVVEVSGTITRNRIDMPLVGTSRTGYKPGRETREGTIRLQKIDTSWEMAVYKHLTQSVDERRAARDAGTGDPFGPFTLILQYDDPDAAGIEKWRLEGVIATWTLPIGFSIGDDVVERDYPITWETETPVYAFTTTVNAQTGLVKPSWYAGYSPPNATTTT